MNGFYSYFDTLFFWTRTINGPNWTRLWLTDNLALGQIIVFWWYFALTGYNFVKYMGCLQTWTKQHLGQYLLGEHEINLSIAIMNFVINGMILFIHEQLKEHFWQNQRFDFSRYDIDLNMTLTVNVKLLKITKISIAL